MDRVKTDLNTASALINEEIICAHPFSRIFSFTTENILGYIDYFDLPNKKLLTVGSSGDQILNAYYYGAKDITLFDINEFAKYYISLKIAAIMMLDYNEFQLFFFEYINNKSNKFMFSTDLFSKIYPILLVIDYEAAYFFNELFNIFPKSLIRNNLFNDTEHREHIIKSFNCYLQSEERYNKLKSIISEINFKFINGNIFKDTIEGKYDNIFLSNLCTTTNIYIYKKMLTRLAHQNLNSNGLMLIAYLWDTNFNSDTYEKAWKDIYKMPILRRKLQQFITEVHQIPSAEDILWNRKNNDDLVILYRKK